MFNLRQSKMVLDRGARWGKFKVVKRCGLAILIYTVACAHCVARYGGAESGGKIRLCHESRWHFALGSCRCSTLRGLLARVRQFLHSSMLDFLAPVLYFWGCLLTTSPPTFRQAGRPPMDEKIEWADVKQTPFNAAWILACLHTSNNLPNNATAL